MQFIRENIYIIILIGIISLAVFLRFYKLSEIPNGLYVDEAEIGYNAYSILQTGKDEFGKSSPLFIRSFNVYAPPLYVYLTTIPVYFFGLTVFATRFICTLSGVFTVYLLYLFFRRLHQTKWFASLEAFLFAISPWSIFFSRGAFEANLALFLLILALYLLTYAKENARFLILSFLVLSLSTYAYHAERLIAYMIVPLSLWFLYLSSHKKDIFAFVTQKNILYALFVFVVTQIPLLALSNSYAFGARALGIFYGDAINSQAAKIFLLPESISKLLAFTREFLANYSSYYSPKNLFLLGDADLQRSIPRVSVLYSWMVIPYIVGLFLFFKNIHKNKDWWPILFLFILSPIPAALAKDPFSSLRALPLLVPILFIITLGIEEIWSFIPRKLFFFLTFLAIIFSFLSLWRSYYVLFPQERAKNWDYGFYQLAERITGDSQTQYIIDESRMNPAYILLAFHTKLPAPEMQNAADQTIKEDYYNRADVQREYSLRNFVTRSINWEEDIYKEQILVGDRYAVSEGQIKEHHLEKVFEIDDPIHEPLFIGYKTNPQAKCESIENSNSHCN